MGKLKSARPIDQALLLKGIFLYALSILASLLLVSCARARPEQSISAIVQPWEYTNLRTLNAADNINPSQAMIALYSRRIPDGLQIRLDMLDQTTLNDTDLFIVIDDTPGGTNQLPWELKTQIAWDLLIQIPAHGDIQVLNAELQLSHGFAVIVMRKPSLDTITVSLTQAHPSGFEKPPTPLYTTPGTLIQVFSVSPGERNPACVIGPVTFQGQPPARAPVLMAFWNTLPAYTPAQTLRRWDGAHTGPLGGRHGLRNLLKAGRDYQIPLALLDLKSPASLSALAFIDGTDTVKRMATQNLLLMPDVIPASLGSPLPGLPGWILNSIATESRQIGLENGIPASPAVYAPWQEGLPDDYPLIFSMTDNPSNKVDFPLQTRLVRYSNHTLLPVPAGITITQATLDGPSLAIRKALIQTGLSADPSGSLGDSPILVLGGDLPLSTWGNPQISNATLDYFRAHPWIWLLDANDLLSARPDETASPLAHAEQPSLQAQAILSQVQVLTTKAEAQGNPFSGLLRQAMEAVYAPISPQPQGLAELRSEYLGQMGSLMAASAWAAAPSNISDCTQDPDRDGNAECILASEDIFTIFNIDSGALTYAFIRSRSSIHQLIAPSSQFITGLSDPSTWRLGGGLAADPSVSMGAFSDAGPFQVDIKPEEVTFYNAEITKTYRMLPERLEMTINRKSPTAAQIPLAIDPWMRFNPGWPDLYQGRADGDTWIWGLNNGFQVRMTGLPRGTSVQTFLDSRLLIHGTEDPNVDFPGGHYLEFPMAVVHIPPMKEISISINWSR